MPRNICISNKNTLIPSEALSHCHPERNEAKRSAVEGPPNSFVNHTIEYTNTLGGPSTLLRYAQDDSFDVGTMRKDEMRGACDRTTGVYSDIHEDCEGTCNKADRFSRQPGMNVVLWEPEIPPNTGNIIRLCANTGAMLHLIHPLGFTLETKQLKRAGLDYHDLALVKEYENFDSFVEKAKPKRLIAIETCGEHIYSKFNFENGDYLLFGSETRGLSQEILNIVSKENILRIPMQNNNRSLNLSNSVAIVLYEVWKQLGFK